MSFCWPWLSADPPNLTPPPPCIHFFSCLPQSKWRQRRMPSKQHARPCVSVCVPGCVCVCVCAATATKRACGKCLSNKYEMVSGIIISCSAASRCLADKATRTARSKQKKKREAERERETERSAFRCLQQETDMCSHTNTKAHGEGQRKFAVAR